MNASITFFADQGPVRLYANRIPSLTYPCAVRVGKKQPFGVNRSVYAYSPTCPTRRIGFAYLLAPC